MRHQVISVHTKEAILALSSLTHTHWVQYCSVSTEHAAAYALNNNKSI